MPLSTSARALLGATLVGFVLIASVLVSPEATVGALESVAANPYHFGVAVAGLYAIRPVFAWPTTPLAVVVGYGFGVTLGVPIALLGVAVTVVPVYLVTRWLVDTSGRTAEPRGPDPTAARPLESLPFGNTLERSRDLVCRYYETAGPIRGVIASRLAPIPSDVATCAAAVSGIKLRHLVVGTVVGELPWTIVAVALGASAATLSASSTAGGGLEAYALPLGVLGTVVAVAVLAPKVYRRVRAPYSTS